MIVAKARDGLGMRNESNVGVARRFYEEVFNKGTVGLLDEIAVTDYKENDLLPGQGEGREGLKQRVTAIKDAFGQTFKIEDLLVDGDKVVVRWIGSGKHVGVFNGMLPTGKTFTIAGIDILRFKEGRIAEQWHVADYLSLLRQLEVIPQPELVTASSSN
jgi:predicted ester cyclase